MVQNQHSGKKLRGNAWLVLLVVSVASLLIGLGDFILAGDGDPALVESMIGTSWLDLKTADPAMANLVNLLSRILGAWLTGLSSMALVITLTAYRHVERWAWYALWAPPVSYVLIFATFLTANQVPGAPTPPALFSAPGLLILSLIGLLLPFRQFFPKDG